jgi:hypothetical protein
VHKIHLASNILFALSCFAIAEALLVEVCEAEFREPSFEFGRNMIVTSAATAPDLPWHALPYHYSHESLATIARNPTSSVGWLVGWLVGSILPHPHM